MTFIKQLEIQRREQRVTEWSDLYRSGWSLQEIGDEYELSRERIRQVLAKAGMSSTEGGVVVKRALVDRARKSKRQAAADERSFRRYGCPASELSACNYGLPLHAKGCMASAYNSQKNNARIRKIEWRMTFPEWCDIWKASGFLDHRGRGADKYAMARRGDIGPYSRENVYIATNAQNISDGYAFRRQRDYKRPPPKTGLVRNNTSGKNGVGWDKRARKWRAHIRVDGKQVHLGLFRDIDDAAAARTTAEEKINAALAAL